MDRKAAFWGVGRDLAKWRDDEFISDQGYPLLFFLSPIGVIGNVADATGTRGAFGVRI